jgi:hypothetical protein
MITFPKLDSYLLGTIQEMGSTMIFNYFSESLTIILLLLFFTKSNIKLKLYEPTYRMGPVGWEQI